ncbi:PREDICTED: alcohol dehydrogenase class-3-like [Nelumbo nucifera]|uniref:Alcohol dehydrogenase class-3-like n=1 Tax=Nelumbo nucifera TaxID=4432 RepID=A0A1U8BL74_NELNU|nr:PREDICTED: alcohol dehydrogenase class-3-like [Nelumbo nucifera]
MEKAMTTAETIEEMKISDIVLQNLVLVDYVCRGFPEKVISSLASEGVPPATLFTNSYIWSGTHPEDLFLFIFDHEDTIIVEGVGGGVCHVTEVQHGNDVIFCYTAEFREGKFCKSEKIKLHSKVQETIGVGVMLGEGKGRSSMHETPIDHCMGAPTLGQRRTTVHVVARIDTRAPRENVRLLDYGVTTGSGAVWNTTEIGGSIVVVLGLGTVSLEVAKAIGAALVISIDIANKRIDRSKNSGDNGISAP